MVDYGFDARGRLTEVGTGDRGRGRSASPVATYRFDAAGRIAELARDNGVATRYSYDMAGQLTDIAHAKGGDTLAASHYELDVLGRRTAQTREDGITERYGYDATSQLTSVDYGIGPNSPAAAAGLPASATYRYDPLGNRTTVGYRDGVTGAPATETYTTNALNQYTAIAVQGTSPSGLVTTALAYDANGNLINDGQRQYRYDAQNRLIAVESVSASSSAAAPSVTQNSDPVVRAEFSYDARNRCVLRKFYEQGSQGQWVLIADSRALTYDMSWNLLAERTLDGRQAGEYTRGTRIDEILAAELEPETQSGKPETLYPLQDALGSTIALVSKHGRVSQRYRFDVYGRPELVAGGASRYRLLFTGREWLTSVALNEHRNRYSSPSAGRWTAPDPMGLHDGANLMVFCRNSSVELTDPSGLLSVGTRQPDSNTIVCDGAGGIVVQLAPNYVANYPTDMQGCTRRHEQRHINDALSINPNICAGASAGAAVLFSPVEAAWTEYWGYSEELECLQNIPRYTSYCDSRLTDRALLLQTLKADMDLSRITWDWFFRP